MNLNEYIGGFEGGSRGMYSYHNLKEINKITFLKKEMNRWLIALTVFAEDWSLVPSTHPHSGSQVTLVSSDT